MDFGLLDDIGDQQKGVQPGIYDYKVDEARVKVNEKDQRQILELDIVLSDEGKEIGMIKFISFDMSNASEKKAELERKKYSCFCITLGITKVSSEKDFIGKGAKILVGKEQKYSEPSKAYAKPYNGGLDAWFSNDLKSAYEIQGKKFIPFSETFQKAMEKPVRISQPKNDLISEEEFSKLDFSTQADSSYQDAF